MGIYFNTDFNFLPLLIYLCGVITSFLIIHNMKDEEGETSTDFIVILFELILSLFSWFIVIVVLMVKSAKETIGNGNIKKRR